LPVCNWNFYIGESTIADEIMDNLAGNANRFDLKGDSLRRKKIEKKCLSLCNKSTLFQEFKSAIFFDRKGK